MRTWLLSLLSIGLGGSAAAVAALALRPWLMCRYTARWRCRLWGVLAAVLLAGPVLLALPLPQLPAAPGWRVTLPAPETSPTDRVSAAQSGEFSTNESDPVENPAHPETDTSAVTGNQPTAETVPQAGNATPKAEFPVKLPQLPKPSLPAAVFALWLVGALGFALWRAAGYWLWSRRVRRWDSPAPEWAAELARAAAAEQGLRRSVPVRCNARISGPLVTGLARPTLLLPETLPPEDELAMICLHEMAHCRRGDLWYMLLLEAARAVHWYSPPVHILVRAARQDIEMACDESAAANKPAAWRRQYCEALLHALECPAGPVLTTRFGVGKSQITARLRQIMKPGRMRRGLLAFCAAALAVALCCCAVRLEPASTSQANTEEEAPVWVDITQPEGGQLDLAAITGQTDGLPEPARPGNEMTDEEIYALVRDVLDRCLLWIEWAGEGYRDNLDLADTIQVPWGGDTRTMVRQRDITDREQFLAVAGTVYSQASIDTKTIWFGDSIPTVVEHDGALYVHDDEAFPIETPVDPRYGWYDYDSLRLLGASEDTLYLEAIWGNPDWPTSPLLPVVLRREQGRWVMNGWYYHVLRDNSFISLPEELEQQAAADPQLGTQLRYAWALGQGLKENDQTRVDWCFSGTTAPPDEYRFGIYALRDISGTRVTDFTVEAGEDGTVWLTLDVAEPGDTPLLEGENKYGFLFDGQAGTVLLLYPAQDVSLYTGTSGSETEDSDTLIETTRIFRRCVSTGPFAAVTELPEDKLLLYLAYQLREQGALTGDPTAEQLTQAAETWLDLADYVPAMDLLSEVLYGQDGRDFATRADSEVWPDDRMVSLRVTWAGDIATVVWRDYQGTAGIVPDYDLVYTLRRSPADPAAWIVESCVRHTPE